jgi:hypothetical protein
MNDNRYALAGWLAITQAVILPLSFVTGMIQNILIGIRLLRIYDVLNNTLRAFAYPTLAAGLLEVTIILSPLALPLLPITCVVLGVVFLKEEEEAAVEFV